MSFLELKGLRKVYGSAVAVDSVNLSIDKGKLVCLLGPSGCGKTTTLRLIAGFMEPTAGDILVGGRLVSTAGKAEPPERRNMSMIFQSYALWPHMSVYENVAYGLKIRNLSREVVKHRVDTILAATKLGHLAERYPGELSGGQQQRVSLARALVVEPEILLLDEPLSNLDANLREEMRFEIRRLHDEFKYTTVYVTHDQSEAMTTADMIVVMNLGNVEQAGTPEDIYQRPETEFVARFIGGTNILRGPKVGANIIDCGLFKLRCGSGTTAASGSTSISIRQHDVVITNTKAQGKRNTDENQVTGVVTRQVYLGSHRDCLISLADGTEIRATTPADEPLNPGSAVSVLFPVEKCRALPR
jgi:iron(III) transport system ATP-binding protein